MRTRDPETGRFTANDNAMMRDGMVNALTGAGSLADPRTHIHYIHQRMSHEEIVAAYRGGWVCRKMVDKPAREMVREWRNWQATPDEISALEKAERRLGIRQKVEKALQLAGLGGAGMILGLSDDPTQPVNPANIRIGDLKYVHVYHRSRFGLGPIITDPLNPWFGQPSYFRLTALDRGVQVDIHPSRVIAFHGHPVPHIASANWEDAFWGDSTVSVVLDAVKNVDTSQNGFASLIKDARNRRLSIPELTKRLSTTVAEQGLSNRIAALAMGESMFGVTFLDGGSAKDGSGGEKIEDRQMDWTGMPALADMFMTAAAGAADMPATVLWGKSPDGMNATGESDLAVWERTVKGRQDLDLRPCIDQLDMALVPSAIGKQPDEDGVDWDWRPLSVMSEPEAATAFWNFMQGFQILVNSGTVPALAIEKLIQNRMAESSWFPGTEAVLEGLSEAERFPSQIAQLSGDDNPSALPEPSAPQPKALPRGCD
jgi:phage-related protein (TIGR01555 family)